MSEASLTASCSVSKSQFMVVLYHYRNKVAGITQQYSVNKTSLSYTGGGRGTALKADFTMIKLEHDADPWECTLQRRANLEENPVSERIVG